MTLPTQLVLHTLLGDPVREFYGLEICDAAGLASGTIHPILARLEAAGWLDSHWEDIDPRELGRPRRRYYRLNPGGLAKAQAALTRVEASVATLRRLRPELNPGGVA